jgi:Uma2 family endonuclease
MLLVEPTIFALSPLNKKITLKDFFKLKENKNNEIPELIDGVIYMSPMPVWGHALAVEKLQTILADYLTLHKTGKFFQPRAGIIREKKNTWLEPDLFFLSNENLKKFKKTNPTTADLVIEVLSISNSDFDRTTKADTYLALGVKEIWLVDLDKKRIEVRFAKSISKWEKIIIYELGDNLESRTFPKIKIDLNMFFLDRI